VPASFPTDITEDSHGTEAHRGASRRDFPKTAGLLSGMAAAGWPASGSQWVQDVTAPTASRPLSTPVPGRGAEEFFEEEGLDPRLHVPGGGAKVVQALAAGQVQFALGDSNQRQDHGEGQGRS
jgi:ABC-type nitrate/sulfonate/bicarbonate transport system substrate-binding protein